MIFAYTGYTTTKALIIENEQEKIKQVTTEISNQMNLFFKDVNEDLEHIQTHIESEFSFKVAATRADYNELLHHELRAFFEHSLSQYISGNDEIDIIRILSLEGEELIRIDNADGKINIVGIDELQDKSDRYYFEEISEIAADEIYISQLDLNRENGQVEMPYNPVMRFGAPIIVGGEKKFYLIMNIMVDTTLRETQSTLEVQGFEDISVVDSNGYFIISADESKLWGAAHDLDTGSNIKNDMPEFGEGILSAKGTNYELESNNLLVWSPLTFSHINDRTCTLVMKLPEEKYLSPLKSYNEIFIYEFLSIIVLIYFISRGFTSYLTKPIVQLQEAVAEVGKGNFDVSIDVDSSSEFQSLSYDIKKMALELDSVYQDLERRVNERTKELETAKRKMEIVANTDRLTGLFNRNYFTHYITDEFDHVVGKALIFVIDVDKFKSINDTYGHNVGDKVLIEVAKILQKSTRESDFVVRYGGDEFLIVLPGCGEEFTIEYRERLISYVEAWNQEQTLIEHKLVLSIGCALHTSKRHILDVINEADKKMYEEKVARRENETNDE